MLFRSNFFTSELMAKRMQLLRELVPAAKRVAVLVNPTDRSNETTLRDVEAAAIGQEVVALEAATGREIDSAFESLGAKKSTRYLSLEGLSSPRGVPSLPFWRHTTRFQQPIRNVFSSKSAG